MNAIEASVSYNEYTKVGRRRSFEIVDRLPEVGETRCGNEYCVASIDKAWLDCEQPKDKVYEYDYYIVTMQSCDDPSDEWNEYYAIAKEEEE